jgi:sec-independent protein translocase protein TatB
LPLFYDANESGLQAKMLSFQHVIIIFVVALVVFGPQKLPELARTLGKLTNEFRKATSEIRSSFEDQMRDLEREAAVIEAKKRRIAAEQRAATLRAGSTSALETSESSAAALPATEDVIHATTPASLPQGDGDATTTTGESAAGNGTAASVEPPGAQGAGSQTEAAAPQGSMEKSANV